MTNAVLAFNEFQHLADCSHSKIRRDLFEHLLEDIKCSNVYSIGWCDDEDASSIFIDPDRSIYAYLLTQARPGRRMPYHLSLGRCPGLATLYDWALMGAVTKSVAFDCANHEQVDIHTVCVTGPARVSLLMTIKEDTYEPIFLIPKELSPIQGLATIYRAVIAHESRLGQLLINRREEIQ